MNVLAATEVRNNGRNSLRRRWLGGILLAALLSSASSTTYASIWPQWEAYKQRFIQQDGRVIEFSQQDRTTSEGQAYAMFHALVAGDRTTFQRLLEWTNQNLASGDLKTHLPAWLWGKRKNGRWGVIDANSASDADLWMAWTLLQAGRIWGHPDYHALGLALLRQIEQREVASLPQLGKMLLPGATGFHPKPDLWRLNLSYLSPQLLRALSRYGDRQLWEEVLANTVTLLEKSTQQGIAPDWIDYQANGNITAAPGVATDKIGYDAVRIYLWTGMLASAEPLRGQLARILDVGCMPAMPDSEGANAVARQLALAPLLKTRHQRRCLAQVIQAADQQWQRNLLGDPARYYDQNLSMFALGWLEKRFAFTSQGDLLISP